VLKTEHPPPQSLKNQTQIPIPWGAISIANRSAIFQYPPTMKKTLLACGIVLLLVNAAVPFCPDPRGNGAAQILSAILGLVVISAALRASAPVPQIPQAAPAPVAPPPPPPRPEAEIVAFLALLQEHGRLVDFVKEDIATASDDQLGSAARVVHSGCRKVLEEYFDITPLHSAQEGAPVTLETGYDAPAHRLLGSVPDHPPYRGTLVHPGWIARSVKLPRVTGTTEQRPWPVVSPAEVQVGAV